MRIAIISDIHANLQALEAVLSDIAKQVPDHVICLGDLVGYGAFPRECLALVREHCSRIVMGNHDYFASGDDSLDHFFEDARLSLEWTRSQLGHDERAFLQELPYVLEGDYTTYVHATLHRPADWDYLDYPEAYEHHFARQATPVCFVGHTHMPAIIENGSFLEAELVWNSPLPLPKDGKIVVNVGSVGQPRDGDSRACYLLYDEMQRIVTYRRVRYEVERAQNGIRAIKMPTFLADRLAEGV